MVEMELLDYRQLAASGRTFDKIASVGMPGAGGEVCPDVAPVPAFLCRVFPHDRFGLAPNLVLQGVKQ